jgi:glutathione S-transferase
MNGHLGHSEFVAGARHSIADISALVAVDFARWIKMSVPEQCKDLRRWHSQVSARPSARA